VDLTLWYPDLGTDAYYNAMAALYNGRHSPKINLAVISTGDVVSYHTKVAAAVASGTEADIMALDRSEAAGWISGGLFKPNPDNVNKYLQDGGWAPADLEYFKYNKQIYGVPTFQGSGAAYYYNKSMFRDAGLDPTKPPQTYTELMQYARKLVKNHPDGTIDVSGVSLRISGSPPGTTEKFRYVLVNFGADIVTSTPSGKWHNGFNNDGGRGTLAYYIDALWKYKVDGINAVHDTGAFETEKTAMYARESNAIQEIVTKNPKLDWGTFILPREKLPFHYTLDIPHGLFVGPNSKHADVAWQLVLEMVSPEGCVALTDMTGWLPVRRGVNFSSLLAKIPQYSAFVNPPSTLKFVFVPGIPEAFNEIQGRVGERLTTIFQDKSLADNPSGIASAIQQLADLTDQILKQRNLYGTS